MLLLLLAYNFFYLTNGVLECPKPAYVVFAMTCVCAPGYNGTAGLLRGVDWTGCDLIRTECLSPAYVGVPGNCSCANGYKGLAVNGLSLSGCDPIPCLGPGYTINTTSGSCVCDSGYIGQAKYTSTELFGCVPQDLPNGVACDGTGYVGSPGSCSCASGYLNAALDVSAIAAPLCIPDTACQPPAFSAISGLCACAPNYTGHVEFNGTGVFGCVPIPCAGPLFEGSAGQCTCGNGSTGMVKYENGITSGCACREGYESITALTGTLLRCALPSFPSGVTCTGTGYQGSQGNCSCASGYLNAVLNLTAPLCVPDTACQPPAFSAISGLCACAPNYTGHVEFNGTGVFGCALSGLPNGVTCTGTGYQGTANNCSCASGYLNVNLTAAMPLCVGVPCPPFAYEGDPGKCTCKSGYTGNVTYDELQVAHGCEPNCTPPMYQGVPGACTCGEGFRGLVKSLSGVLSGCVGIPCVGPMYTGTPGQCSCSDSYTGKVRYVANSTVGCALVVTTKCLPPAYEGLPGKCKCAEGYMGVVSYVGNITTGCAGLGTGMTAKYRNEMMSMQVNDVQVLMMPSPEYPMNGTIVMSTTTAIGSATVSSQIFSVIFMDSSNETSEIANLSTPFRFTMGLEDGGAEPVMVCASETEPRAVAPACGWWDHSTQSWSTEGCTTSMLANNSVECSCNHFTDFACIVPQSNRVPSDQYLQLTPANIALHPGGLITVSIVLCLFVICLVWSIRIDAQERQANTNEDETVERAKKWEKALTQRKLSKLEGGGSGGGSSLKTWWKHYRTGLQTHHTWGSILWRRKGTSFRSVDRTFVTLNLVLSLMCLSASFHARNNSFAGRIEVIIFSLMGSFPPSLVLMHLFSHTGEMGLIEMWQLDKGLIKPHKLKCLRYRFAEKWKWVWYTLVLVAAVGMIVYILSIALMFDQNPWYFCRGETTLSWIVDFITPYAISIFGIEPLKIGLLVGAKHMAQQQQYATHRRITEDTQESVSTFTRDSYVDPSIRVDVTKREVSA